MGILSAFLVNDTIALLGIPLIIYISKHIGIRPVVLLISLAFGISVGSTMTPIGNPQNLLIAILINLFLTYMILRIYFRKDLSAVDTAKTYQDKRLAMTTAVNSIDENASLSIIENPHLAKTSTVILLLTIAGFIISEFLHLLHIASIGLSEIALLGAAVLYILSGRDCKDILKNIDYSVLVFFVAMFVVSSALVFWCD